MMEFNVTKWQIPERIQWNYEELKNELTERVKQYETLQYTEDQIKEAKADRANLNKLKKALNDERIRKQKEYMAPFDEFKAQVDEIIKLIDRPAALIDKQVKEYEEAKKAEKEKTIREYLAGYDLPFGIDAQRLFDPKMLNATVTIQKAKDEIAGKVRKICMEADILSNVGEYQAEAVAAYVKTLDLGEATRAQQEAKANEERVRRWREEQERRKAEEAARRAQEAEKAPKEEDATKLPEVEIEPPKAEQKPLMTWVNFSVLLDVQKAKALKRFFEENNIEFRRI